MMHDRGMRSAPQMLHMHMGQPHAKDCNTIPFNVACWVCGGIGYERGIDAVKFTSSSMTDQNQCRNPDADFVCEACVYVRSRTSPVPGRTAGACSVCKGKAPEQCPKCEGTGLNSSGGNFRNYSHLFDLGANPPYANASKGEKPAILSFLRGPKFGTWFAAIADSGQKQVLPYAPVNAPGSNGRVVFDDALVVLPNEQGWKLVDDMRELLTVGATKEEIINASYGSGAWQRCQSHISQFEERWSVRRGSSFFGLALWLSQRDETAVQSRIADEKKGRNETRKKAGGKAPDQDRGTTPIVQKTVSRKRGVGSHALGSATQPNAIGDKASGDDRPVGNVAPKRVATPGPKQFGLFGDS